MKRLSLAIIIIGFGSLVVLNGLAYKYFWYWRYRWSDMPMHFLGGVIIGALAIFFTKKQPSFWAVFSLALLVAVSWELFEFKFYNFLPIDVAFKMLPVWERGVADTVSDIIFDIIGAIAAYSALGFLASRHTSNSRVSLGSYDRTKENQN